MAKFLLQLVLHDAASAELQQDLNAAMAKRGFVRELAGKKASYHLPPGSYWYEGELSPNDLRMKAGAITEDLKLDAGMVVVRVDGWSVMRLKRVEAAPQG